MLLIYYYKGDEYNLRKKVDIIISIYSSYSILIKELCFNYWKFQIIKNNPIFFFKII